MTPDSSRAKARQRIRVAVDAFKGVPPEKAYVTLGIGGGFALDEFISCDGSRHTMNRAFLNVLAHYLGNLDAFQGCLMDAGATGLHIFVEADPARACKTACRLLEGVSNLPVEREAFERARETAIERFARYYKDESFRAHYHAFEKLHYNKRFSLSSLAHDVKGMTFEEFSSLLGMLLEPGNLCMHILGSIDCEQLRALDTALSDEVGHRPSIQWVASPRDPYLCQDAHVVIRGRTELCVTVIALLTDCLEATAAEKRLLVDLLASVPGLPACVVEADALDAGLIFEQQRPKPVKSQLAFPGPDTFEAARGAVLARYASMAKNDPRAYGALATDAILSGFTVSDYLESVSACSFSDFEQVRMKLDPFLREFQVVVERVSGHGRVVS